MARIREFLDDQRPERVSVSFKPQRAEWEAHLRRLAKVHLKQSEWFRAALRAFADEVRIEKKEKL